MVPRLLPARHSVRSHGRLFFRILSPPIICVCFAFLATGGARANSCSPPKLDGDLSDMIAFAKCLTFREGCGLISVDPERDVCRTDPEFSGCAPFAFCEATGGLDYLPNGADISVVVAAYDIAADVLYVGLRVPAGQVIGDADGGGTCNDDGCPGSNIVDQLGIGPNEKYLIGIDVTCEFVPDITIEIRDNQMLVNDAPWPGTHFSFLCDGSDLEASVSGIGLGQVWHLGRSTASFNLDGMADDLVGPLICPDGSPLFDIECGGPTEIAPGGVADYTVQVSNTGETDLANITASVALPKGLDFASFLDDADWGVCSENAGLITCSEANLPFGAVRTLAFRIIGQADCFGSYSIAAHVEGESQAPPCGELTGLVDDATCTVECESTPPVLACPRRVNFWAGQCACARGERGHVQYSCDEMNAMAACIDDHSTFFAWDDDLTSFCSVISPPTPEKQRGQAKRQFAALLANVCAGELGLLANNGDIVSLPLDTPISGACDGLVDADNVGELIKVVDELLTSLEGQSLDDPAVKEAYGKIITCLDRINHGIGIPFDPEECVAAGNSVAEALVDQRLLGSSQTGVSAGLGADLFKPMPNPFTQGSRMAYSVSGPEVAQVEISIYNTAGQKVRTLVSSAQAPGRYEANWDGRNDRSAEVPAGVYFYRSVIGGESIISRAVLMR